MLKYFFKINTFTSRIAFLTDSKWWTYVPTTRTVLDTSVIIESNLSKFISTSVRAARRSEKFKSCRRIASRASCIEITRTSSTLRVTITARRVGLLGKIWLDRARINASNVICIIFNKIFPCLTRCTNLKFWTFQTTKN